MIVGERIVLRAWERSDMETFRRWFDDAEVTIYLGEAYPALSIEQEEEYYESRAADRHKYSIVTRDENVLIGNCALFGIQPKDRSAELGIVIGEKAYWNRGYGREAIGLLLEMAFDGLGLHRVWLRVMDFNERAHRCYQAAGLIEEGRLREDTYIKGHFCDTIVMGILAEEYRKRRVSG
jgi:diamine N-acetyltransferase